MKLKIHIAAFMLVLEFSCKLRYEIHAGNPQKSKSHKSFASCIPCHLRNAFIKCIQSPPAICQKFFSRLRQCCIMSSFFKQLHAQLAFKLAHRMA